MTTALHILQFIERLILVSILRDDSDIRVARDQTIHQVRCDPALVMVFEDEFPVAIAAGQIRRELDLNLSESFFHLLGPWEINGDQPRLQTIPVKAER